MEDVGAAWNIPFLKTPNSQVLVVLRAAWTTASTEVFPPLFPCPFAEACHQQEGEGYGGEGGRGVSARCPAPGLWRVALAWLCVPYTDTVTCAACVFKALRFPQDLRGHSEQAVGVKSGDEEWH